MDVSVMKANVYLKSLGSVAEIRGSVVVRERTYIASERSKFNSGLKILTFLIRKTFYTSFF